MTRINASLTVGDNNLSLYSTFPTSTSGTSCSAESAEMDSVSENEDITVGGDGERASQGERGTEPRIEGSFVPKLMNDVKKE